MEIAIFISFFGIGGVCGRNARTPAFIGQSAGHFTCGH
jgi:hypothetical protein